MICAETLDKTPRILATLRALGAERISVGSARDREARAAAHRVATAWRETGGTVVTELDWPERAASWLRQARRFVADAPDAWVVCARPDGWVGMTGRLAAEPGWDAARAVCWSALQDEDLS